MREIFYQKEGNIRKVALLEDGALCEYFLYEQDGDTSLTGAIYKGRIERIVPGMHAAFVHIGFTKNGFLPLDESPFYQDQKEHTSSPRPSLQTGQEILVQVKKDPSGEKGAYLTRDITFPGKYMVFMPLDTFIGVSRRVKEAQEREKLLSIGREIAPDGAGLVMRAASLEANQTQLEQELQDLKEAWLCVQNRYPLKNAPCLLYENLNSFQEMLRDYPEMSIHRILTNVPDFATAGIPVEFFSDQDTFLSSGIQAQVEKALQRKVWLKSGGYLIIDVCEALTVIDVNTGKFTGKKLLEETVFALNLEACEEISRQIRLRNMGGIILVDFIDMQKEHHRQAILEAMAKALSKDRIKTAIHGFTTLGLMELTRKKSRLPLHQTLMSPCAACRGTGWVLTQGGGEKGESDHG